MEILPQRLLTMKEIVQEKGSSPHPLGAVLQGLYSYFRENSGEIFESEAGKGAAPPEKPERALRVAKNSGKSEGSPSLSKSYALIIMRKFVLRDRDARKDARPRLC